MTTFFYRFDSEQAYKDAITVETVTTDAEGVEVVESVEQPPLGVDVVGVITKIVDDEPVALDGYHVNLPYDYEPWAENKVVPANPVRIFWGS